MKLMKATIKTNIEACLKEYNSMLEAKSTQTHTISKRLQTKAVKQQKLSYVSTGKVSISTHSTLPHTSRPLHLDSKQIFAYQILFLMQR